MTDNPTTITYGWRRAAICNGRIYDRNQATSGNGRCRYCGRCGDDCRETTCKACGITQCMGNGLGRGTCAWCYIGILPGWSGADAVCAYKGCGKPAVVHGTPKHNVCDAHLRRWKAADAGCEAAASLFLQLQESTR